MSIWTPTGERPVRSSPATTPPPPRRGAEAPIDEEAARATVDELRRQLAQTPADVIIANHAYGLFELAAVYLSENPPRLGDAQLAIDALGGLIDALGERLGEAGATLRDALAQVRLGFVQVAAADQARRDAGDGA